MFFLAHLGFLSKFHSLLLHRDCAERMASSPAALGTTSGGMAHLHSGTYPSAKRMHVQRGTVSAETMKSSTSQNTQQLSSVAGDRGLNICGG